MFETKKLKILKSGIAKANESLWPSDFSQLAQVQDAKVRQISSSLAKANLIEVQLDFINIEGQLRQFIVSGIDLDRVPQLQNQNYSNGVYIPLGFGTHFTQKYAELVQNLPQKMRYLALF